MRLKCALFLSAFTLLSSCASNTANFSGLIAPSTGKAVIYIYRVDLTVRHVEVAPNVRVNYESIGPLTISGYYRVEVEPGPTQVALYTLDRGRDTYWRTAKDAIVNLNLAPNSIHFVQLSLDRGFFSFREISRDVALQSLPDLYLLN